MKTDYGRKPEIWNDEDGDFAWVDVTAQTPDVPAALAWLIDHGHEELELFDSILYEAAEGATIDPASISPRGVDVIVEAETVGDELSDSLPIAQLVQTGKASATWRFDISVAALQEARDAA